MVCGNDEMAIGALGVLRRARLNSSRRRCRDRLRRHRLGPARHGPPLTTVHQPMRHLGERAVQVLLERIAEPTTQAASRSSYRPNRRIRRSCGCAVPQELSTAAKPWPAHRPRTGRKEIGVTHPIQPSDAPEQSARADWEQRIYRRLTDTSATSEEFALPAPAHVQAVAAVGHVRLSWEPVSGAAGYLIERSGADGRAPAGPARRQRRAGGTRYDVRRHRAGRRRQAYLLPDRLPSPARTTRHGSGARR